MEQDYNMKHWAEPCRKVDCRKKSCSCGLTAMNIPAVLGDDSKDSKVAPRNGAYCNSIVTYEANGAVYIYSSEGIPVKVSVSDGGGDKPGGLTPEQIAALNAMGFNIRPDGILTVTYDVRILDVDFRIQGEDLIVDNNIDATFNINNNGEMEVTYDNN